MAISRFILVFVGVCLLVPTVARANDETPSIGDALSAFAYPLRPLGGEIDWRVPVAPREAVRRPAALLPLYGSLIALNSYDAYATHHAVTHGRGAEVNPLMRRIAGHPLAFSAVKAGAVFTSIYVAERLWRQRQRRQAVVVMALSTSIAAIVAARNASMLRATRLR